MFDIGRTEKIKISLGPQKIEQIRARVFYRGLVAVFLESEWQGQIGVPFWENQLAHKAFEQALDRRKEFRYGPDIKIYQKVRDVYSAQRQTLHILHANYGRTFDWGEKKALSQALKASQRLHEQLLVLRKSNLEKLERSIRRETEHIINRVGQQPRNEFKKEARDLAAIIGEILDSRGRVNPFAKIAQVDAMRRRLEERLQIILAVESKIASRRRVLQSMIEICELRFRVAEDFIERLLPNLNLDYFERHEGLEAKVAERLEFYADEISRIKIQPFTFPAQEISREFCKAAEMIRWYEFGEARVYLKISRESLGLRVIRTDVENFITYLTQLMFRPNRSLLSAELKKIRNGFKNIKTRLKSVDEAGFRKPVCREALNFVNTASRLVRSGKIKNLKSVKKYLVEASRLL